MDNFSQAPVNFSDPFEDIDKVPSLNDRRYFHAGISVDVTLTQCKQIISENPATPGMMKFIIEGIADGENLPRTQVIPAKGFYWRKELKTFLELLAQTVGDPFSKKFADAVFRGESNLVDGVRMHLTTYAKTYGEDKQFTVHRWGLSRSATDPTSLAPGDDGLPF